MKAEHSLFSLLFFLVREISSFFSILFPSKDTTAADMSHIYANICDIEFLFLLGRHAPKFFKTIYCSSKSCKSTYIQYNHGMSFLTDAL